MSHVLVPGIDDHGGNGDVVFAERLMSSQRGHALSIAKNADSAAYHDFHGCRREGDKILVYEKDITHVVDQMVKKVLTVAVHATKVWYACYQKLAGPDHDFEFLEELQKPRVPEGCLDLGTFVEVSWTMWEGSSHERLKWFPAQVLGVHDNKTYVVRYLYERGGDWGDTERHVHPERVRVPTA